MTTSALGSRALFFKSEHTLQKECSWWRCRSPTSPRCTARSTAARPRSHDTINTLYGVSADGAGDAWTVGYYYIPGDSQAQTLIEQWDGSAWHMVASPNDGTVSYLYGAATVSSAQAWAVGQNASNTALVEE